MKTTINRLRAWRPDWLRRRRRRIAWVKARANHPAGKGLIVTV